MNLVVTQLRSGVANLSTGVGLRYVEQGDPSGHTVVLLHGYTDSSYSFSRVLPLFDESYHVYALDQRGHGDSERPPEGYALRDFAADVIAFLDELNVERASLVGHCMGSLVAQRVAINAPHRVARLALVSSMTDANRIEGIGELQRAIETFAERMPAGFVRDFQSGTVYARVPEDFMDGVVRESLKVPARVWRATLAGLLSDDHTSWLGRIEMPTLVFWGEEDALLRRAEQDALMCALAHADMKAYADTGHSPHWEQPERFVRDLEAFIGRAETG